MATVPRLSGATVAPNVVQGGEMRAYDHGEQALAQGVQNVARVASDIAQREIAKQDDAALMAFQNALSATENSLLYDPDNGAYAKQGADAMSAPQTLWPEWDNQVSVALDALPTRLRPAAERMAVAKRNDANKGVMRHVMRQSDAYHAQQAQTMVAQSVDAARLNYLDPERVETEAGNAMIAARASADRIGADDITRGRLLQQATSGIYQAVVERRMIDDPVAARDYYETVRDRLTGAAQAELEAKFRPLVEDEQVSAHVAAIRNGGPEPADITIPPVRGVPLAQVEAAIDAAASKHGVPREVLYALAEQESGFRAGVKGEILEDGDRAEGLFQYRKTTADEQGLTNRSDPVASADVAARQFRERMDKHGIEYAIAAHFAGDGGAAAVVQRGRSAQNPKTAEYLRQVMGRMERWRGQFGGGESAAASTAATAPAGPAMTEADALEAARRIANPDMRRKVQQRIREDYALENAREAEAEKARGERVYAAINADPTVPLARALGDDYAAVEAAGKLPAFENYRKAMLEGRTIQSDPLLVDEIDREMVLDPTAFSRRDIRASADSLSASDMGRYLKVQADINKPGKEAEWGNREQRLASSFAALGLATSEDGSAKRDKERGIPKKRDERQRLRGEFRLAYDRAIETYTQLHGKGPDSAATDAIMRTVQRQFSEQMIAGTTSIYTLAARGRSEIDEADRRAVRERWFEKYGRLPTDAEVTMYVTRARRGDRANQFEDSTP